MTAMRLSNSLLATEIAERIGVNTSTISRYENGHFTLELADLDMLERYALSCCEDRFALFTDYLLFRKYHKQILQSYIEEKAIQKSALGRELGVSKTLALSWFNKENRCPSIKLWEDKLKVYANEWLNINL